MPSHATEVVRYSKEGKVGYMARRMDADSLISETWPGRWTTSSVPQLAELAVILL